jgi:hypothetical protein
MQICKECCAVEQGTKVITENNEPYEVCAACEFPADACMITYDEDYGSDR